MYDCLCFSFRFIYWLGLRKVRTLPRRSCWMLPFYTSGKKLLFLIFVSYIFVNISFMQTYSSFVVVFFNISFHYEKLLMLTNARVLNCLLINKINSGDEFIYKLLYYCLLLRELFSYSVVWGGIVGEGTIRHQTTL
jgi:hypothetical protein